MIILLPQIKKIWMEMIQTQTPYSTNWVQVFNLKKMAPSLIHFGSGEHYQCHHPRPIPIL